MEALLQHGCEARHRATAEVAEHADAGNSCRDEAHHHCRAERGATPGYARAQRLASSSQVQLRCKKLSRDLQFAYRAVENRMIEYRKEEGRQRWRSSNVDANQTKAPEQSNMLHPSKRQRHDHAEAPLATLIRAPLSPLQRQLTSLLHRELLASGSIKSLSSTAEKRAPAVASHELSKSDSERALLFQTRLLIALRAVSAHPRLHAPPVSPFVMLPVDVLLARASRGKQEDGCVLLPNAPAAVLCIAPVVTWSVYQQRGVLSDDAHRELRDEVRRVLVWCGVPIYRGLHEHLHQRASLWSGSPSIWVELLSVTQAPAVMRPRNVLSFVQPRVYAKEAQLASPCCLPQSFCLAPFVYASRRVAYYMRPRFEWAASLREQIASAFGDESGVEFKPMLPFLGMRSLLQESGKLQQTDILLRRLLSVATSSRPTTTVLLFCHCPHAAHLLQRLLVYRRFTHAAIAEATPPAQRSRKLQAVRQTRVHVLLFQGASFGPALGIRAAVRFALSPHRIIAPTTPCSANAICATI